MTKHKVFVYGTLKRGRSNHSLMEAIGAEYQGGVVSPAKYYLRDTGSFPIMFAGGQRSVFGELYLVPSSGMADLDNLENEGVMYRRETEAFTDNTGFNHDAFVYIGIPDFWNNRTIDAVEDVNAKGELEW